MLPFLSLKKDVAKPEVNQRNTDTYKKKCVILVNKIE